MTGPRRLLAVPALGSWALAAGCGGGSPGVATVAASSATTTLSGPTGGGSVAGGPAAVRRGGENDTVLNIGNAAQGARFAACIRRHGEPGFPDPNARGEIRFGSAAGVDPRSPVFGSAFDARRSLLPGGFESAYAACRSHLPPGLPGKALGFVPPVGSS